MIFIKKKKKQSTLLKFFINDLLTKRYFIVKLPQGFKNSGKIGEKDAN